MSMLRILGATPKALKREIFDADIRRVARIGWLLNALSMAVTILLLPGGIKSWQVVAVAFIAMAVSVAVIIEMETGNILSYWIIAITLLALPIIFSSQSHHPWIAYGLLVVCSAVYASATDDLRVSIPIIYLLILLQYIVSKLNFPSISDNVDNQLLSSFFATSWTFLTGIGAIFVRRAYIQYYDEIENTVKKVEDLQLLEARKIRKLNMEDHLNGQLHGTVLNTLIAIKNSPDLLRNRAKVWRYLSNDLLQLEKESVDTNRKLEIAMNSDFKSAAFRSIKFQSEIRIKRQLTPIVYEVIREIVRELALNTKKHSDATESSVLIEEIETPLNPEIQTSIVNRDIVITYRDNAPTFLTSDGKSRIQKFNSESVQRLISNVEGTISKSIQGDELVQVITFRHPESPLTFINQVATLRKESITYLSRGFISLSVLYAVISLPAYLYLGIDGKAGALFITQILLLISSLRSKKYSLPLAALGSLTAIAIFPVFALNNLKCQEIQYLPWIFNGLIGAAFFVTLLINHKILKWAPIVLFYLSCLIIENKLPIECENLLDGSTPAILIIVLFSLGISFARTRTKRAQEGFIAQSMSEFKDLEATKFKVLSERERALSHLSSFIEELRRNEYDSESMVHRIQELILILKTFLISSEYFHDPVVVEIYEFAMSRNIQGLETRIEINTQNFACKINRKDLQKLFKQVDEMTKNVRTLVIINRSETLLVTISALDGEPIRPNVFQKNDLKIQVLPKG